MSDDRRTRTVPARFARRRRGRVGCRWLPADGARRGVRHPGDGRRRGCRPPARPRLSRSLSQPLAQIGRGLRVEGLSLHRHSAPDGRRRAASRRGRRRRDRHRLGGRRRSGSDGVARQRENRRRTGDGHPPRRRPGGRRQLRRHRPAGAHRRPRAPPAMPGARHSRRPGRHPCGGRDRSCRFEVRTAARGGAGRRSPESGAAGDCAATGCTPTSARRSSTSTSWRRRWHRSPNWATFDVYDFGGGLGVRYTYADHPPTLDEYAAALVDQAAEPAARAGAESSSSRAVR